MDYSIYNRGKAAPRLVYDLNARSQECDHTFTVKADQTHTDEPKDGFPPTPTKKAAGICQRCRWHIEVMIQFDPAGTQRCPSHDAPLHFFRPSQEPQLNTAERKDIFVYACIRCSAILQVIYRPPRIDPAYFDLLIDPANLKHRYDRAIQHQPTRQGLEQQRGIRVLDALISYLNESLIPTRESREIPSDNKRFMTSFGEDCEAFLKWLRFEKLPMIVEDDKIVQFELWRLPEPPARDPFVEGLRCLIEDVKEEILAKIRQYPDTDIATLRSPPPKMEYLQSVVSRILGYDNYPAVKPRLRKLDLSGDEYYSGLGALPDFADDLLLYCFQQSLTANPEKSSYFFDCLSNIAKRRETEDLTLAVAMFASEGYVSQEESLQAYRYFGFRPDEVASLDDEHILRSFNVRLESSPRHQESELRERLRILGKARGSTVLTEAAENDFKTADQALKWLDPAYNGSVQISDDHVIALAASKKSDAPDQIDLCKKAVGLIASERNSDMLRVWVREGSTIGDVREEEISAAYRYFGIADRTSEVDLDVLAFYTADYADDPVKGAEARRHYKVIYDLKNNTQEQENADYFDRPVGLENMGNTCYLNCLLQFLYVIRPLRDLIYNFEQLKLDTEDAAYEPKTVDNIVIPRLETIEAQKFVVELRGLFEDMAGNSRSMVRPTWSLAKLALKRTATSGPARRSTIGGDLPILKSPTRIDGPSVLSSQPAPPSQPYINTANSSEVTLIDSVPKTPEDDEDIMLLDDEDSGKQPVRSDSPVDIAVDSMDPETVPLLQAATEEPPSRPPPVPPRPIGPVNKPIGWKDESSKREAEAAAQQQDVVESMGYALDKIQYSVKNDVTLPDGKVTDTVHQLFYGDSVWRYINSKVPDMAETFSTINVALSQKPKNISAGLDNAFSVEEVDFEGKTAKRFRTITQPPPIFQIYFQRQEYDPTRGDAVILKHHIQLEEVIYLDRFMTHEDKQLHEVRKQSWEYDQRLNKLIDRKQQLLTTKAPLDAPQLLDATWKFVSKHPELVDKNDADLLEDLDHEVKARNAKVTAVSNRIEELDGRRTALFSQHKKHAYRLAAVFVHRGQGGSVGGHYWIYIYDFEVSKWRRYEDREVREVANPQEEIFKAKDPEVEGAPYFVVYVKEDSTGDIVDALWRNKPEEAEEEQEQEQEAAVAVAAVDEASMKE